MTQQTTDIDTMDAPRAAVRDVVPELVRLVRSIPDRNAPAVGTWRVGDVAAHICHVFGADTDAIAGEVLPPGPVNTAAVAELTATMLAEDGERDPAVLANRIEELARRFDDVAAQCRADRVEWLGGALLPPSAVACHLLEECLVHGHDIATAIGRPWPIRRDHAVLAIEGAAFPIISALPTSFVRQDRAGSFRARIDIRLRGGGRNQAVLHDGSFTVESGGGRDVDAHVSADPATLLLLLLGRIGRWKPLTTGRIVAWGRRPKKLLQMLSMTSPP